MHWHIRLITILIFVLDHINRILTQGMPLSPCPKLFQYRFDGNEWFGLLSLLQPNAEQPLQLKVILSMRGKPTNSAYLGEIELLTRGQFQAETPLLYKVKFPQTHFPPKLLQISANNQIICLGVPEQSMFVTQIQLEHTRKITFINDDASDMLSDDSFPTSTDTKISADTMGFDAKQLPANAWEQNPLRIHKDICGKIDKRISFAMDSAESTAGERFMLEQLPKTTHIGATNRRLTVPPVVTSDDIESTDSVPAHKQQLPSIARGAWPWLAAIYVNNLTSLTYQCAGTLISKSIVLSAAHCFHMLKKQYTANEVLIFLGRHNLKNWNEEQSVAAPVDEIFLHPEFDVHLNSYDADIAVIVLKHNIQFNTFIRPACLWSGSTNAQYIHGERGIVVGWNLQTGNATAATAQTTVPRIITAPIVSNAECFSSNEQLRSISSNRTFCAGIVQATAQKSAVSTGFGPCRGDSGAGLMILKNKRWMLRGTVSATLPNKSQTCSNNQYVIYTDVAKFLDWIYAFIL